MAFSFFVVKHDLAVLYDEALATLDEFMYEMDFISLLTATNFLR